MGRVRSASARRRRRRTTVETLAPSRQRASWFPTETPSPWVWVCACVHACPSTNTKRQLCILTMAGILCSLSQSPLGSPPPRLRRVQWNQTDTHRRRHTHRQPQAFCRQGLSTLLPVSGPVVGGWDVTGAVTIVYPIIDLISAGGLSASLFNVPIAAYS